MSNIIPLFETVETSNHIPKLKAPRKPRQIKGIDLKTASERAPKGKDYAVIVIPKDRKPYTYDRFGTVTEVKAAIKRYRTWMDKSHTFAVVLKPSQVGGLNYKSKSNFWTNSTGSNTFDPERCEARSFRWWPYIMKIKGKIVFNSYRYSSMTSKHQSDGRSLLKRLGLKITYTISAPKGLTDLDSAKRHAEYHIDRLIAELSNPRNRKIDERKASLRHWISQLKLIERLSK